MHSNREVILTVRNAHIPSCGKPPEIDLNSSKIGFCSYFESGCAGDQFIMVYDRHADTITLYAGDAGWEKSYTVGEAGEVDLVLAADERAWIAACMAAIHPQRTYYREHPERRMKA